MDKDRKIQEIRQKILECCQTECVSLDLSDYRNTSLNDFLELKDCIHLKEFTFHGGGNTYNYDLLKGFTQLETLSLGDNPISSIGFLKNLTNLKRLNLEQHEPYSLYWEKGVFANLQRLESLNLSSNSVDLSILKGLINLKALNLSYTHCLNFSSLKYLTNLKTLNLSHTNVSDISFIEKLEKLESLNIEGNKDLSDVSVLLKCTRLKSLNLLKLEVKEMSIYQVADLISQNPLESLKIDRMMGSYYKVWFKYDGVCPPSPYRKILTEYKGKRLNPGHLQVYAIFKAFRIKKPSKELFAAELISKSILDGILREY